MDLNYLLHRQQIERSYARTAACEQARNVHGELAALYEKAIEEATRGRLRFIGAQSRTVH